jgi:hypothetical protein
MGTAVLLGTIAGGVSVAYFAARATVAAVIDLIPDRNAAAAAVARTTGTHIAVR